MDVVETIRNLISWVHGTYTRSGSLSVEIFFSLDFDDMNVN